MVEVVMLQADGDELFAALPGEVVEPWKFAEGDRVLLVETEQGILIMPYDDDFARVMEIAERVSDEYAGALRKLAE